MFALIEIPHRTPARYHIYDTDAELISAAYDLASRRGEIPEELDRDAAIEILVSDLHGHILVETPADLDFVRRYTGHQAKRVIPMADPIACEFQAMSPQAPVTIRPAPVIPRGNSGADSRTP